MTVCLWAPKSTPTGLWSQVLNRAQGAGLRPGLFLDRDGLVLRRSITFTGLPMSASSTAPPASSRKPTFAVSP